MTTIAPDDEELTIQTGGSTLGGWLKINVTRGVERCPSSFDIELTERYPGGPTQASVTEGASCAVFLSGTKILTGYIDRYMPSYDAESHRVRIIGRSCPEDIVDSSVNTDILGTWQFIGGTIGQAAKKICAPNNVSVSLPDGDASLPTGQVFSIYPGYTCYFLIEEMARAVGMLVWDDANGNLVISKGGTGGRAGSSLVEGQNIEAADAVYSMDQRFQTYKVGIQGPDAENGHFTAWGIASDNDVPRPRFKMIQAEGPYLPVYAQQRAQWEASRRYGRSRIAQIRVTGWRDGAGNLWTPNTMVAVNAPTIKLNEDRVISEASYIRDDELGTITLMTLIELQGLQPEPFFPLAPLGVTGGDPGIVPGAAGSGNASP